MKQEKEVFQNLPISNNFGNIFPKLDFIKNFAYTYNRGVNYDRKNRVFRTIKKI